LLLPDYSLIFFFGLKVKILFNEKINKAKINKNPKRPVSANICKNKLCG
jgi:hypothetical protein